MEKDYEGSYKIHIAFGKTSWDVVPTVMNPYSIKFETPKGEYTCIILTLLLKPQDSFGRFVKHFLDHQKVDHTIRKHH